jgi:hypothetical protein
MQLTHAPAFARVVLTLPRDSLRQRHRTLFIAALPMTDRKRSAPFTTADDLRDFIKD